MDRAIEGNLRSITNRAVAVLQREAPSSNWIQVFKDYDVANDLVKIHLHGDLRTAAELTGAYEPLIKLMQELDAMKI